MILKDKRIFYIEDDNRNRAIVQMILEQSGATVSFDSRGITEQLIPKLCAFEPDLILTDLMFPGKVSGYDIFAAVRTVKELDGVPVVVLSASDPEVEIPKARARGLSGFIGKPLDIRFFANQIAAVLHGDPIWDNR
jgi:CheY-like chemotaxis protein